MNWNDGIDCTWPGTSSPVIQNVQTLETMRSSVVVAWVAVHLVGIDEVGKTVENHCGTQ